LRHQRHVQVWDDAQPERSTKFSRLVTDLLQGFLYLPRNSPGMFLKKQTRGGERSPFPRRWRSTARRPISRSRICWETAGCETPRRLAARLKLPASANLEKISQLTDFKRFPAWLDHSSILVPPDRATTPILVTFKRPLISRLCRCAAIRPDDFHQIAATIANIAASKVDTTCCAKPVATN